MDIDKIIEATVLDIEGMTGHLRIACGEFSKKMRAFDNSLQPKPEMLTDLPAEYWRYAGINDALTKLTEFSEAEIRDIPDNELAYKARYFCDLILWVRHLSDPAKDANEYLEHLLRGTRQHAETVIANTEREVALLRSNAMALSLELKKHAIRNALLQRPRLGREGVAAFIKDFDQKLVYQFSMYRKPASGDLGGYADMVEQDILQRFKNDLARLNEVIAKFEAKIGRKIKTRHNSTDFARSLGMEVEFKFIFPFASQHVHATPVSLSSPIKDISKSERLIFLEYLRAKMHDMLSSSLFLFLDFRRNKKVIPGLGRMTLAYSRKLRRSM